MNRSGPVHLQTYGDSLVRRLFSILDSAFVSRVGNARTLVGFVGLGLALVILTGVVGAKVVDVDGWIPVACFALWGLIALVLVAAWTLRRQPSTLSSPFGQLLIGSGLPGSSSELVGALARGESRAREFIAEAAIFDPVNNQAEAAEFARSYREFEAEVASLLTRAADFDARWELFWDRKPSWARDHMLESPFTRESLDVLARYVAHRARQLGYMMEFLRDGDDRVVRHIRGWVAHDEAEARSASADDDGSRRFDVLGSA
jgi:hypothetical protein